LKNTKFHITLVIHSNHAQEFDDTVRERLWATRQSGVHLLNQSVLLAGINDDVKTQTELAKALLDAGVLPYYLHLLDRVQGAAHFEVAHKQALALYEEMRAELPGYLLAKLVHEQPGESGKTIIGS